MNNRPYKVIGLFRAEGKRNGPPRAPMKQLTPHIIAITCRASSVRVTATLVPRLPPSSTAQLVLLTVQVT